MPPRTVTTTWSKKLCPYATISYSLPMRDETYMLTPLVIRLSFPPL